jgi:tetrahydromethanopterin S-methyltransferase subunit G
MKKITKKVQSLAMRVENALGNKRGETTVGSGVAILTAVVLGALLLAGLYALLGDVVLPALTTKIQSLFNYAG